MNKDTSKSTANWAIRHWQGTHYALVISLLGVLVVTAALASSAEAIALN